MRKGFIKEVGRFWDLGLSYRGGKRAEDGQGPGEQLADNLRPGEARLDRHLSRCPGFSGRNAASSAGLGGREPGMGRRRPRALRLREDLQDCGGVRRGDLLPPHKYIKNTSTGGSTPAEHLLNAGRRPQTSQKAKKLPTYLAVGLTRSRGSGQVSGLSVLGGRAEFRTLDHQRPPGPT